MLPRSQPPRRGPAIFPEVLLIVSKDRAGTNCRSPTMSRIAVRRDGSSMDLVNPCMAMAANTIIGHALKKSIWKATRNSMAPEVMAFTIWAIKIMRWRLNRSAITPENSEINGLGRLLNTKTKPS